MLKKLLAVTLLLAMLIAVLPADALALKDSVDVSKLKSLVYDHDATLHSEFGAFNKITIKSGAHVVFKGGFEIAGALIVEPGATLTGVSGGSWFALVRDCTVEGIDLWYRQEIGSGETDLKKIPQPVVKNLNSRGLSTGFKWDAEHECWVLDMVLNGNRFNLPAGGIDPSEHVELSSLKSKTYTKDAVMNYSLVTFNAVTIKSGAHVVCSGCFAIAGSLTVEPGASFTGVDEDSKFCFVLERECVVDGLDLWYRDNSGGKDELRKIPQPVMASLKSAGVSAEFKWDAKNACWVLVPDGFSAPQTDVVNYHSDRDRDVALRFARGLQTLGLLRGAGKNSDGTTNFALNRQATRAEALTMLVRLLGKEEEALNGEWQHPFTDVPSWADPYVGYSYATGLTKGVSATKFGTGNITFRQYMTFLLRALGYTDADAEWSGKLYDDAMTYAERGGMFRTDNDPYQICTEDFLRMDMVVASWRVMQWTTKEGSALYERLADQGLFTREDYVDVYLHA